ncbi:class I SAM-dependent methyltransferase [Nocardia stercoris]|uniref:Class I SAM-dependent methyltransferase n=1 Tax=Nocardia stercoris TaxID=2483361 RepID=A0A3M2KTC5_9NOCA|nr:class I SAM-dependent methyltransferase [Nocardia stercoris]RMI27926.1 class I SAM-dependent methyltransferase [Nocardia stercoris]
MDQLIPVELGTVQETLLITLAGRARESVKPKPILVDPKAVEIMAALDNPSASLTRGSRRGPEPTVLRTAILDTWVREFLAAHPDGTVVEIGTGLNARFERVDNGRVHWLDLDLADTIALRRHFFTDTERRRMVAASALDDSWFDLVAALPGPYCFVAEGVLLYLPEAEVRAALTAVAARFPDATVLFDHYSADMMRHQHRMADKGAMDARWAWTGGEPESFAAQGLRVTDSRAITDPPPALRRSLPRGYRVLLPVLHRVLPKGFGLARFRTDSAPPA